MLTAGMSGMRRRGCAANIQARRGAMIMKAGVSIRIQSDSRSIRNGFNSCCVDGCISCCSAQS